MAHPVQIWFLDKSTDSESIQDPLINVTENCT